ncbi:hypothetical protein SynSYN20_01665 [Synechococcus sp. SYN20]|uniref:hypothetical protein n=1 Tax=Synechococcus sp. SYN20 TaxID=1050714 RepID=UPI0018624DCD|nr:hypothetical protein [Synechococcus sp. SYN20]QNJ25992.1 hypothetical protein SynSYN20_01665 [Synechococcus sp. SYN20]
MSINRPELKNTIGHRFATDTAIAWRTKNPITASPPDNVPLFPGQLIAVRTGPASCDLYVGSDDRSRWLKVGG